MVQFGFWLFFSFRGRIGRGVFWLAILANALASLLVELALDSDWMGGAGDPGLYLAISIGLNGILSISATAAAAKRFHDRGKTAWLAAIAAILLTVLDEFIERSDAGLSYAVERLLNLDASPIAGPAAAVLAAAVAEGAMLLWLVIDLGVLRGNAGANRYGPAPAFKAA
jgi:uncharacterized membrane protein YhaH (DUF805 family)